MCFKHSERTLPGKWCKSVKAKGKPQRVVNRQEDAISHLILSRDARVSLSSLIPQLVKSAIFDILFPPLSARFFYMRRT